MKLLVVDDDLVNRGLAERLLSGRGHTIVTAIDGNDGLIKMKNDVFDMIITDHEMPGCTGRELATEAGQDSVVILMSGEQKFLDDVKDIPSIKATVHKPYDLVQFIELVERIGKENNRI